MRRALRSETCGRSAPRFAHKGNKVTASSRLFRSLRLLHNRQFTVQVTTHRPQGPSSPGSLPPARPSVPRIHTKINIILYHFYPWTTYISFVYQTYILIVLSQKTKVSPFLTFSSIIFFTCLNETGVKSLFP